MKKFVGRGDETELFCGGHADVPRAVIAHLFTSPYKLDDMP